MQLHTLTNLKRTELFLANARMYLKLKQYKEATRYFDKSSKLAKEEQFPYSKGFDKIIEDYVLAGRKTDAITLVDELLERQAFLGLT
ncbi:hypothetical protein FZC66_09085 [Priestia megaterium]|nr:hypothetical protein FZC66_09085 [Priestia megaterium]